MRRTMTTENRSTDVSPHSAIRFNRKKRKKNARWPDPKKCLSSSNTHMSNEKRFRIGSLPGGHVCVCRAGGETASNLKGKQLLFMESFLNVRQ